MKQWAASACIWINEDWIHNEGLIMMQHLKHQLVVGLFFFSLSQFYLFFSRFSINWFDLALKVYAGVEPSTIFTFWFPNASTWSDMRSWFSHAKRLLQRKLFLKRQPTAPGGGIHDPTEVDFRRDIWKFARGNVPGVCSAATKCIYWVFHSAHCCQIHSPL